MSETLLIILGVTVFTITVVGVLWYLYLILMVLEELPVAGEVPSGADNDDV